MSSLKGEIRLPSFDDVFVALGNNSTRFASSCWSIGRLPKLKGPILKGATMSATAQTLRPPSRALMLLEGRAIHELGAFLGALPLLSLAPRGDGHPVLVLPGLVASDTSTRPLRSFLKSRGYAASGWRQGRNLGPLREHRGREQPLRHGPSSRRGLCHRRSLVPARRPVGAVRPQRVAQFCLSRSRQVKSAQTFAYLVPLAGRGRILREAKNPGEGDSPRIRCSRMQPLTPTL